MATEERGYLTDTGRVVRRSLPAIDPGRRRAGGRRSLDGDEIIGRVTYREQRFNLVRVLVVREWVVEAIEGSHDRRSFLRSSGTTRADAVERFLEALALWQRVPPQRDAAAEARRPGPVARG